MTERGHEPRRDRRRKVDVSASCKDGAGKPVGVAVTDLSESGCKVESVGAETGFAVDEAVVVHPQGLDALSGRVRWSHEKQAGIEFASKLHPALVDHAAGESAVEGLPPVTRPAASGFTDHFGRPLPALGSSRRR